MDNSHRPSSTSLFIAISYVEGTYPPSTSFIAFIIFPKRTGGFHQVASHLSVIFPPNDRSCFARSRLRGSMKTSKPECFTGNIHINPEGTSRQIAYVSRET